MTISLNELVGKQIISFSGGRTSAYLCYLLKKMGVDVDVIFMDTGAEHPATYDFVKRCNEEFNLNLTCLRTVVKPQKGKGVTYRVVPIEDIKQDLQPYFDMCRKYSTPYTHGAFCTKTMKTTPFEKYCKEKYGKGNYTTWLGIRADEPRRLPKEKKVGFSYLADISDFEKQDILDFWKEMPFDLELSEFLGNCVFCVKKGNNKLAIAAKDEPHMAANFIKMVEDDSVPINFENDRHSKVIMYRKGHSLRSIIAMYEDVPREDIVKSLRRSFDTGSCSESCEVFSEES
jgi:hypothetical protein